MPLNTAQKLQSVSKCPVCSEHLNYSAAVNNLHIAMQLTCLLYLQHVSVRIDHLLGHCYNHNDKTVQG